MTTVLQMSTEPSRYRGALVPAIRRCAAVFFHQARRLLKGWAWAVKATLCATLVSLFFSCPPYEALEPESPQWRTRAEQIANPFHDQAIGRDPRSHDAKRTFRITVPVIAHYLGLGRYGVITLAHLSGVTLLFACCVAASRLTGDRMCGLLAALLCSLTTAGTLAFEDFSYFFWDEVALASLVLAQAIPRPSVVLPCVFVAAFTDERGFVASSFVFLQYVPSLSQVGLYAPRSRNVACVFAVVAGWVAYLAARAALSVTLDAHAVTDDAGLRCMVGNVNWLSIGTWGGLEGGWYIVASAMVILLATRHRLPASMIAAAIAVQCVVAYLVGDLSRSLAYLFPAVFVAIGALMITETRRTLRRLLLGATVASLLWPNINLSPPFIGMLQPFPFQAVKWLIS